MTAAVVLVVLLGTVAAGWGGMSGVRAAYQGERIPFDMSKWKTDFSKHSVPLTDFMSGGPPKDGIPAIDRPNFDGVADADKWLQPKEPVILVERDGEARAYPLQILIWHEIVNLSCSGIVHFL